MRTGTALVLMAVAGSLLLVACDVPSHLSSGEVDAPDRWELTEELRIGALDDPEYALSRIPRVALGPDEAVYIAQPHSIRVFDREGQYLRELGREGQGPGEFQSLTRLGWQGDSLWVVDYMQSRVTWYHRGMELAGVDRIEPIQLPEPFYSATPRWVFSDGSYAMEPLITGFVLGTPAADRIPIARASEGAPQRVILRYRGGLNVPMGFGGMMGNEWIAHIFRDTNLFVYHPDGASILLVDRSFAATDTLASFRVSVIGVLGDTIRTKDIPYHPIRLDPQVANDMVEAMVDHLPPELAADVRTELGSPAFYPPVSMIAVGNDGRIWLRRELVGDRETYEWLVLDAGLVPVGTISLPKAVRIYAADEHTVWGAMEGELGVPYLVKYRIRADG